MGGRRACVTGARGALGVRLVRRLAASGRFVRIVAFDISAAPAPATQAGAVTHVAGDIRDDAALDAALDGCDTVFHLAALADAHDSTRRPLDYFDVNVLGTVRVLDACRRVGVPRALGVSTVHVYGIPEVVPIGEDAVTSPRSPYAASKLAAESAFQGFAGAFGLSCDIVRLVNLYGSPYTASTVVGRALTAAVGGRPIELRSLSPVRDFLYVDDAAEALERVAEVPLASGASRVMNVGTGVGTSIAAMADAVANVAAAAGLARPAVVETDPGAPEAVPALVADIRRFQSTTGWQPATTLEDGLRRSLAEMTAAVR